MVVHAVCDEDGHATFTRRTAFGHIRDRQTEGLTPSTCKSESRLNPWQTLMKAGNCSDSCGPLSNQDSLI